MTFEDSRARPGSLLNKVSKLRSKNPVNIPLGSSRMSPSLDSTESLVMAERFEHFTALPLEIQAHILSFIPSRILHKTISRTCRYYRKFTESHTRRRILDLMSPYSWDIQSVQDNYRRIAQSRPVNVLVFEAQRPIDTITTKHTLHFSHFSSTSPTSSDDHNRENYGSSTLVHFSFTPVDEPTIRRDQSTDSYASNTTMTSSVGTLAGLPFALRSPAATQYPMVHADDQERLNPRSVTSSVTMSSRLDTTRLTPSRSIASTPRSGSIRSRQFTDVASPTEWRESSSRITARLVPEGEESTSMPVTSMELRPSRFDAANLQGDAYEGFSAASPLISGHWSEPIASSSAAYERDRYESSDDGRSPQRRSRRSRQKQSPTYAFELDPLDSFESWILSLKLQRRSQVSNLLRSNAPASTARPMRWEKPVSEGLDRVFREWFHPHLPPESRSLHSALQRATLIASLNSNLSYASSSSILDGDQIELQDRQQKVEKGGKMMETDDDEEEMQPEPRVLEFDGPSCTLTIQPHPVPFESHPALTSMYSHHYLSHASLSSSLTSRVEFTFHCDSVTINAARLLNALEDVDEDVQRANDLAKQRGAQVVAGNSGSTSWSYSAGGSNNYTANTSRWSNAPSQGSVAVVVFAQARD